MMQRFRIRTRLMAGFLAVAILLGIGAVVGIWRLSTLNDVIEHLVTDDAAKLSIAQSWEKHVAVNLVRTHTALLLDDKALVSELRREMDVTSTEITKRQKEIEAMAAAGEEQSALEAIGAARNKYRTQRDELLKRRQAGENVRDELSNSLEPLGRSYLSAVGGFVEIQERELANAQKAADEAVRRSRTLVIALMVVGFGLAIVAATLIARSITVPVTRTRESALRISQGDLTEHLEGRGRDEVSEMVAALGSMQDALRAIAEKVRGSADAVSTAATQIAVGNTDLSSRTEEQATSLEETAASIEEMTATVNQNAQNASQANEVAASAARIAQRGGEAVNDVVRTMVSIQQSARKIGDIIGVIDSIAFQTNILALNAAVEAARAGDQGRGFAVVASEVRSLAQRSADAAKEIKTLITDSVGRIDAGAKTADDTGQTMREVVDSVKRVSTIIGEIAAATKEQSSGIAMVNQAVAELDKATQLNASLVQESSAASEALRNLATDMVATAAVFRTEAQATAPALIAPKAKQVKRASMKPKALAAAGHDDWTEF